MQHAPVEPRIQLVEHRKDLLEVQHLVRAHDIEAAVEGIGLLAVEGRSQVAGGVDAGAVALLHEAGRGDAHVLQVHDAGALVALHQQAGLLQQGHGGNQLVLVEGLALLQGVEGHAEAVIDALELLERDLAEPGPEPPGLGIALLQAAEPGAALVAHGGVALFFGMEAHVELEEPEEGGTALLRGRLGPVEVRFQVRVGVLRPAGVGRQQGAELGTPVAQVVEAEHLPAQELVQLGQGVADHGGPQVADGEELGDVGRAVLDDHPAAVGPAGAKGLVPRRLEDGPQHGGSAGLRRQL